MLNEQKNAVIMSCVCNVKGKQFCAEGTIYIMVGFLLRVFGKGDNYSILGYDFQRVATLWEQ